MKGGRALRQYSTVVLSAGVDTLTCSVPWEGGINSFIDLAQGLQREDQAAGSKVSPFKRGSYRGAQTKSCGIGFKPGRVLAELRGTLAHEYWPHFTERAEKVSRLDVEVSVRQEPYDHDLALRLWLTDRKETTQRGRPSDFRLQAEAAGGTTLYVGTGASRYQARLYERWYKTHAEGDKNVWRYEVQCRRERAQQVAALCLTAGDAQALIQGAVHRHFTIRGLDPIFDSETDVRVAPLPTSETDREKSLRWLGSSVAPALERHKAWGSYEKAKRVLGLEGIAYEL